MKHFSFETRSTNDEIDSLVIRKILDALYEVWEFFDEIFVRKKIY